MREVLNFIENSRETYLNQLFEFLRIPSVSADPKYKPDIERCALWVKDKLKEAGVSEAKLIETGGNPIVYGEWLEAGKDKPTVLIYGHYDVQPVDPLELWDSDPFEPTIKNGKIYARGSSDDKGQVFTHIKAFEAFMKTKGKAPVNVKFLIEGEEEAGEGHIEEFIAKNKKLLAADVSLISDTEWFADGMPSICYALRGIAFFEIEIVGPSKDLHSGTYGGGVDNPAIVLADIISRLKDKYGRITIPGFYDDVLELTEEEKKAIASLPFDLEAYKKEIGVSSLYGEIGYSPLERVWARPSLDVNGIKGGYIGEGAKTVLPSKASAKISMRLVPNQKADDVIKKAENYVKELAPPTVKIEFKALHGGNPVLAPIDSPPITAAKKALKKAFGKEPAFMREGGSIPVTESFLNELDAPPVLMGLGLPGDNIHSPNESLALENFYGGVKASAYFLDEYSKID